MSLVEALASVPEILASLAGGAFGAAIGPLPAFVFTGIMVIAGEASVLAGGDGFITNEVAFGPAFSPAVSFAGGVAGTAYAAKKGYMDEFEWDYHQAKNIVQGLGTKPDVLAVGAVFGLIGWWMQVGFAELGMPWDPIAMGVVLSAIFHRLILGYSIIGKVRGSNILDMTPFERGERRTPTDGGETLEVDLEGDGVDAEGDEVETEDGFEEDSDPREEPPVAAETARLAVEPWLPHQYRWSGVAAIGAFAGVLGGWIAIATTSPFLAFGISAATLLFLNLGIEKVPVTHHITLPAGTAALAVMADGSAVVAGFGEGGALIIALVFGVACALFAELFQRVFYAHGDTHVDPPAAAIVFGTFVIAVLALAGVFAETVWVPLPG